MLIITCSSCLLLFLFSISPTALSLWSSRLHLYRRRITVEPNFSPSHLEELLEFPTGLLFFQGKIFANCSDLLFRAEYGSASDEDMAVTTLLFWNEEPMNVTNEMSVTRLWVRIPEVLNEDIGDRVYAYYGLDTNMTEDEKDEDLTESESEIGSPQLKWTGSEVHLFDAGSCPVSVSPPFLWTDLLAVSSFVEMDGAFLAPSDPSPAAATGPGKVHELEHTHVFSPATLSCVSTFNYVSVSDTVCKSFEGSATTTAHMHVGSGSSQQTGDALASRPDAYRLRPCLWNGVRSISHPYPYPMGWRQVEWDSYVGLFVEQPGLEWDHVTGSQDRFVLFGSSGGQFAGSPHSHDVSAISCSTDFTDPSPELDTGGVWIDMSTHNHGISLSGSSQSYVGPSFPDHYDIHLYRPNSADTLRAATDDQFQGRVRLFNASLPPLGYLPISGLSPNHLLRIFPSSSTDLGLSLQHDEGSHQHSLTGLASDLGGGSTPINSHTEPLAVMCPEGLGMWGNGIGLQQGSQHQHNCIASTLPTWSLPKTVHFRFALKVQPERATTVGLIEERRPPRNETNQPGLPDGGGHGLAVGLGLGLGLALFFALLLFVGIVAGILIFVFRRSAKQRTDLETPLMDDDERLKKTMAKLKIRKELFEIEYGQLDVKGRIGKGGSQAHVFKAEWASQTVAFKCFSILEYLSTREKFREFEKEVELLASLSHPNVLRFFGASLAPPRVGIVMEFCANGDLKQYVDKSECDGAIRLRLLTQTAFGMQFLHAKRVLHRDLKPENVLVSTDIQARICDFGISKLLDDASLTKTRAIGTSCYMAPELFSGHYGFEVDVFSFGIMLFTIMTLHFRPYGDAVHPEVKVASDASFRPRVELQDLPDDLHWTAGLMQRCWVHQPEDRPDFAEIVKELKAHSEVE